MAKKETQQALTIVGVRDLLKALSKIDKDLQAEVRNASGEIAADLVSGARNAAHTPLQSKAAAGLSVKRDRVPAVQTKAVKEVFYGAEFGGGRRPTTRQFPPHRGQQGYFLYPYARAHGDAFADRWGDAVDKAFKAWDDQSAKYESS